MTQGQKIVAIAIAESIVIAALIGAFLADLLTPTGLAIVIAVIGSTTGLLLMTMLKKPNVEEHHSLEEDRSREK